MHDDYVGVTALFEAGAHRGRASRAADDDHVGALAVTLIVGGHDEHDAFGHGSGCPDAVGRDGVVIHDGELFRSAVALALTGGDDHGRDRHDYGRTEASFSSAASVSTFNANVSSETRIWRARVSMRFSPADSPLSLSRIERFRTTSATW